MGRVRVVVAVPFTGVVISVCDGDGDNAGAELFRASLARSLDWFLEWSFSNVNEGVRSELPTEDQHLIRPECEGRFNPVGIYPFKRR